MSQAPVIQAELEQHVPASPVVSNSHADAGRPALVSSTDACKEYFNGSWWIDYTNAAESSEAESLAAAGLSMAFRMS